jgi:hypothetical protein
LAFDVPTDADGEYARLLPLPSTAFDRESGRRRPMLGPLAQIRLRYGRGDDEKVGKSRLIAPGALLVMPDFDWNAAP